MYCVREDGLHSEFLDEPLSQGQLLATICLGKARESRHTPCQNRFAMGAQIETSRVHRTWFDNLKLWPRAYETKIFDSTAEAIGRSPTPEGIQKKLPNDAKSCPPTS